MARRGPYGRRIEQDPIRISAEVHQLAIERSKPIVAESLRLGHACTLDLLIASVYVQGIRDLSAAQLRHGMLSRNPDGWVSTGEGI